MDVKKERKVSSGSLIRGSSNDASAAASHLLDELSLDYDRCCVIVIMNESKYDLVGGKYCESSGVAAKLPERIASHASGLIASHKSVKGTRGVLTYQFHNLSDESDGKFLQIMWQVPLDMNTFHIRCNVNLGNEEAQPSLLRDMKNGNMGILYKAEETPVTLQFTGFKAGIAMSASGKTILAIKLMK